MPPLEVLKELQDLHLADDIEIPPEAEGWTTEEAGLFFESGGQTRPAAPPAAPVAPAGPPPPPRGVFRWAVVTDDATWDPQDAEWRLLIGTLPAEDQEKVMKFRFRADQKRALVSRLLQRRACFEATGVKMEDVVIKRTKGSKPYMANKPNGADAPAALGPNWNFNVSHEGNFVALASEPNTLVGVDVAAPEQVRNSRSSKTVDDMLKLMEGQFTPREFGIIRAGKTDRAKEDTFRKFWSLKEAYTKARGDGIAFEFKRCDFTLDGDGPPVEHAAVAVDGQRLERWRFYIQPMPDEHWVSTSRGPPADAVDALGGFRATFGALEPDAAEHAAELARPEPPFEMKTIESLVPDALREKYRRLVRMSSAAALTRGAK